MFVKPIIATGTPGTGKTTLAKMLAKCKGYQYIDVNKVVKDNKLGEGYDKKRRTKIIDVKRLNKVLIKLIEGSKTTLVIDSHLSHYLPKEYVKLCIVTVCDLKTLSKRLKKRHYPKKKIEENLEAEIFRVCLEEAREQGHKILVIDTSKGVKKEMCRLIQP